MEAQEKSENLGVCPDENCLDLEFSTSWQTLYVNCYEHVKRKALQMMKRIKENEHFFILKRLCLKIDKPYFMLLALVPNVI